MPQTLEAQLNTARDYLSRNELPSAIAVLCAFFQQKSCTQLSALYSEATFLFAQSILSLSVIHEKDKEMVLRWHHLAKDYLQEVSSGYDVCWRLNHIRQQISLSDHAGRLIEHARRYFNEENERLGIKDILDEVQRKGYFEVPVPTSDLTPSHDIHCQIIYKTALPFIIVNAAQANWMIQNLLQRIIELTPPSQYNRALLVQYEKSRISYEKQYLYWNSRIPLGFSVSCSLVSEITLLRDEDTVVKHASPSVSGMTITLLTLWQFKMPSQRVAPEFTDGEREALVQTQPSLQPINDTEGGRTPDSSTSRGFLRLSLNGYDKLE